MTLSDPPKTVADAVETLLTLCPREKLDKIWAISEEDLPVQIAASFHFGIGMYIRNQFGLWAGNQAVADDCVRYFAKETARRHPGDPSYDERTTLQIASGVRHPDTLSSIIITELWRRLRGEKPNNPQPQSGSPLGGAGPGKMVE